MSLPCTNVRIAALISVNRQTYTLQPFIGDNKFLILAIMLDENYYVEASPDLLTFEFVSAGPKGSITKVVRYTEINIKGFYNLGLGDKDETTGYISDLTVTNNNDSQKVLATVALTLYVFISKYPDSTIIATGSSEARTRLYRMGITNNLTEIQKDFIILGLTEKAWEPFRKNITYSAFLVRRKL